MNPRSLIIFLGLATAACGTTANINGFRAFAELGQTYETAVVKVIDQANAANIDADSQQLLNAREQLVAGGETAQLPDAVSAANEEVLATNRVYARLRRQVALLNDYFEALGALAGFEGDSAIGQSTGSLVQALQSLFPGGERITIGNAAPAELASGVATLVVANLRSRRLSEELRRHGGEIDRQLQIQAQLLDVLAEDIRNDQELINQRRLLDDVVAPFAASGSPPANWAQRRRDLLLQISAASAPAEEAAALSRRLRLAFVALAEGRLQAEDLVSYANDLSRLVALAERIGGGN